MDVFDDKLISNDSSWGEQPIVRQTGAKTPWRRLFAWELDTSLCWFLWVIVATLVFRIYLVDFQQIPNLVQVLIGILLNILLEPICLSWFGTTPGKWLFGLHVKDLAGEKLGLGAAFKRTLGKIWYGTGFSIPFYNLYRLYKSGKACDNGELLPWESASEETIKDTRAVRCVGYVLAEILVVVMSVLLGLQCLLPPNRGDITAEQFAENYNYCVRNLSGDNDMLLTSQGTWEKINTEENVVKIDLFANVPVPKFIIKETGGTVTSVSFTVDIENWDSLIPAYTHYMETAVIAFGGAQKNVHGFEFLDNKVLKQIESQPFDDFTINYKGVTICNDVTSEGLVGNSEFLIPPEDGTGSLHITFTLSK